MVMVCRCGVLWINKITTFYTHYHPFCSYQLAETKVNKDFFFMSETLLIAIIGIASTLLSGIISFTLGQRAERQKQSLLVRAKILKPIDEWLKGGEKMVSIFSYTISSVAQKLPLLIGCDFN